MPSQAEKEKSLILQSVCREESYATCTVLNSVNDLSLPLAFGRWDDRGNFRWERQGEAARRSQILVDNRAEGNQLRNRFRRERQEGWERDDWREYRRGAQV